MMAKPEVEPRRERTVRLFQRELKAIEKDIKENPELWSHVSDWVHEAIRQKLRRNKGFL